MRLGHNTGTDQVIDMIRQRIGRGHRLNMLTPTLSLFAFAEIHRQAQEREGCRLVVAPERL